MRIDDSSKSVILILLYMVQFHSSRSFETDSEESSNAVE
jgi:hypothetical protein